MSWGRVTGRGKQRLDINEGGEGTEDRKEKCMRGETQVEHREKQERPGDREFMSERRQRQKERRYRKSAQTDTKRKEGDTKR